jgi:superfamily I DNA and/or RNA helicase
MAALNDPGVRAFVGTTHNGYVDEFKKLDTERLDLAAVRVRRAHAEHAVAAMNKFSDQERIIRSESAKSSRHKPLRKVFGEAKDVSTAFCPCWRASPLSVCQLIGATGIFDYVILDEASQVLPEDAIPSILRGKHVIVVGDNKQLPPTTFFSAAEEEDDSEVDATGYESLFREDLPQNAINAPLNQSVSD